MKNSIKDLVLSYKLSNFNTEDRTAKLLIKQPKGQKTFNVKVSPLTAYFLNNQFEEMFECAPDKKTFKSTLRSPEFKENPFRLVKYSDDNYMVYLVKEAKPKKRFHTCPVTGDQLVEYINMYNKKKNYIRYFDASTK